MSDARGDQPVPGASATRAQAVLLIGYGNASRRDDGVAVHVLQRLRARLGLDPDALLAAEDIISDDGLGSRLSMVCLHQLAPELAEVLAEYDVAVFIDAHVGGLDWAPVHWREVEPVYEAGVIGHHLKPGVVLALCHTLYGRAPRGYTLSVLGYDFDFGEELSPATSALADQAVERLLALVRQGEDAPLGQSGRGGH